MSPVGLPSGLVIELREMTGAEEELLTDERLVRWGLALNKVLTGCITRIGDKADPSENDVAALLSGDRLAALVALRRFSLGDEVDLTSDLRRAPLRRKHTVDRQPGPLARNRLPRGAHL